MKLLFLTLQVTVEIPYISLQALLFVTITYPAINFYWSAYKMIWYSYTLFSTLLYFNYLGMMFISLTPTFQVASVLAGFSYTMLNLFAGFIIPEPVSPLFFCQVICNTTEYFYLNNMNSDNPILFHAFSTENSKMVGLGLLDLPNSLVPESSDHFTIWRYKQGNISIWRTQCNQCFLQKLLWV